MTGCLGQLGRAIQQHWDACPLSASYELVPVDADQLDLTDSEDLRAYLNQLKPRYLINAAAFTQVDRAESASKAAFAVNGEAVFELASWCKKNRSVLIQLSTDFVFDGRARTPYLPDAETAPLSVYGASKLSGEDHVRDLLPHHGIIVRTSWLYSEFGSNFVKTMMRLMRTRSKLSVINDQIGSPTSAHTLAQFILALIAAGKTRGVFHWTDGGEISWFDFATAIYEVGTRHGLLPAGVSIFPIKSADYHTPATRPSYSVLDRKSSLTLINEEFHEWRSALDQVVKNLAKTSGSAEKIDE